MNITVVGSTISGTLSIQGDDSWLKHRDSIDQLFGFSAQKLVKKVAPVETVYSWLPWCIVKTDHESWMSIETIHSEENSYLEGEKTFRWCPDRFEEWSKVFSRY